MKGEGDKIDYDKIGACEINCWCSLTILIFYIKQWIFVGFVRVTVCTATYIFDYGIAIIIQTSLKPKTIHGFMDGKLKVV